MRKSRAKLYMITTIFCLLPMVAGIVFYNKMPDSVPIHFDMNDNPDNYVSKISMLFIFPLLMTVLHLFLFYFVQNSLKLSGENAKEPKLLHVIAWFVPILNTAVYTVILIYTLNGKFEVGNIISLIIGVFMIVLGNYLPKMNYESGKNMFYPLTKDEKSFRRISKITGYLCMVFGLWFLILIFLP